MHTIIKNIIQENTTDVTVKEDDQTFEHGFKHLNSNNERSKRQTILPVTLTRLLMTSPPYPNIAITTKEAAVILGLSEKTLRNWRWKGGDDRPAWVKLGNRRNSPVRYPLPALLEWRDSHARISTTEFGGTL